MKVLFYTNIPSPYRVDFFNELGKQCELTVLFELGDSTERDEEWKKYRFQNFKGIILNGIRLSTDTAFCPQIVKYLKRNTYDMVVVSVLASPTAILATSIMKLKKIPYCYEGDGGFVGSTSGIKAWIKRYIISSAELCLSTSKPFDEYCVAYGAKSEKVYRYPFSSVKEKELLQRPITSQEKMIIKNELGIKEDKMIISVGQVVHRKGFDLFIEACKDLDPDVGIYIIGGQPTEEYLRLKEKYGLHNLYFLNFMNKKELNRYYQAADLFALFTRYDIWGLVINEAMANALPVISTDKCVAAIELIDNAQNGYVVESENLEEMKLRIEEIILDDRLRAIMADNSLKKIREYTIENMAVVHMRIFENERKKGF